MKNGHHINCDDRFNFYLFRAINYSPIAAINAADILL